MGFTKRQLDLLRRVISGYSYNEGEGIISYFSDSPFESMEIREEDGIYYLLVKAHDYSTFSFDCRDDCSECIHYDADNDECTYVPSDLANEYECNPELSFKDHKTHMLIAPRVIDHYRGLTISFATDDFKKLFAFLRLRKLFYTIPLWEGS